MQCGDVGGASVSLMSAHRLPHRRDGGGGACSKSLPPFRQRCDGDDDGELESTVQLLHPLRDDDACDV